MNHNIKNLLSIQYLRGGAAVLVTVYHIALTYDLHLDFGRVGVDIFFVISGFIMLYVTHSQNEKPFIFIKKRIIRVVPLYWAITCVLFICASIKPNLFPLDHPEYAHLLKSLFFIPHTAPDGDHFPFLGQGWTLNYEMFFYVVFSCSLFFTKKTQLKFIIITLFFLFVLGNWVSQDNAILTAYTSPLLLEFLAGVIICSLIQKGYILSIKMSVLMTSLSFMLIIMDFIFKPDLSRSLTLGAPSALIVFSFISLELKGHMREYYILKLIGDASYSIYLTHFLTYVLCAVLIQKIFGHLGDYTMLPIAFISVLVGIIVYYIIENPLLKLIKRYTF